MLFSPVFIGAEPGPMFAHYAVLPSPSLHSGPKVLLLSKLKAPINHAESTLLQVFFLKNLKSFGINWVEKSLHLCLAGLRIRWFDPIAEASELPKHLRSAELLGSFGDRWAPFFVTDSLVQD